MILKLILIAVILVALYSVVKYFVKNKAAAAALEDQLKADATKLGKDISKKVGQVKKKL